MVSPSEVSPELSRPFRGLRMWLSLQLAGVAPFRAALEEKLLLARYFHGRLAASERFEVGGPPDLSVVPFRLARGDDAANRRLAEAVQDDGRIYLSTTQLGGLYTLRLAILSARTHRAHVDLALDVLHEHADRIAG